ncbi:MAG: transglutaminase family protein [bacterium]|nr:transglutaminase family protein [bacterium]
MAIYQIKHKTQYLYNLPVTLCDNKALIVPRTTTTQRLLEKFISIQPEPVYRREFFDYFGNIVLSFSVREPHTELTVVAQSAVECFPRLLPDASKTPSWETAARNVRDFFEREAFDAMQYLYESAYVPLDRRFREYAAPSFPPGRPVLQCVLDLTARVNAEFKYDPNSTDVATPVFEVLESRRGVCQDFAHLQIACLRAMGVPAKYVSGYLRTTPPPGKPRLQGADASHAWVSVYVPGAGWIDVDPTNNAVVSTDHIVAAWGRDFDEISPIKGIILGGGTQTISVAVDVIPADSRQPATV